MTVHDWTRVDAGLFHAFHLWWLGELGKALNAGRLPPGYYALPEQHSGPKIADVLTLHESDLTAERSIPEPTGPGAVAVAAAPPRATQHLTGTKLPQGKRRTLTIRHVTGHRIVALVEVVSPSNKDRRKSVQEFVAKVWGALMTGVHVTVLDLHPPRRADPGGLPGVVWTGFAGPKYKLPPDKPLTFAAFKAGGPVEGFFTHLAVGDQVPDVPLFLTPAHYVNLPLAMSYEAAFRDLPEYWQRVLEAPAPPTS